MTTTVRALIERYQQHGVKEVSHIFYEGARHESLNDFCRDQIHADVLAWLEARLSRDCQPAHRGAGRESSQH